jgi:hypothetical protein
MAAELADHVWTLDELNALTPKPTESRGAA